ncbi:hypothetical protein BDN72DRAFT_905285 [Pluteus cervinus]|uniref:Uncharacterized protein n=1 Tax=Pluteus cervinus TaxID=181527 RepID=A0ACD3A2M6_9AGAR|nr:hypothetical protein BDN72DRAFT_905285 [Pluteus cervinus]
MPTSPYSILVLIILMFQRGDTCLWHDPEVMLRLGLTCTPTATTLPKGLDVQVATELDTLFQTVKSLDWASLSRHLKGATCVGRDAWRGVFGSLVGPSLNSEIDKILTDLRYHPQQLAQLAESAPAFPDGKQIVQDCAISIAIALFGPVVRVGGLIESNTMAAVTSILFLAVARHQRRYKNAIKTFPAKRANLQKAMNAIMEHQGAIPVKLVATAQTQLDSLKRGLLWSPRCDDEVYEKNSAILVGMLQRAGYDVPESTTGAHLTDAIRRAQRESSHLKIDMRDAEEVEEVVVNHIDHLQKQDEHQEFVARDELLEEAMARDTEDLGVSPELAKSSAEKLAQDLDFPDGKPRHWATHRHQDPAINTWTSATAFESPGTNQDLIPNCLLWHQLVGVTAMVNHAFAAEEKSTSGFLLADGVGVGKTTQVMAFIAFLQIAYRANLRVPPIIMDRPFFMGKKGIPNRGHLIIAPLSIGHQWKTEVLSGFDKKSISIYCLTSNLSDVDEVFKDGGSWARSPHDPIHRICIVPLSAFQIMAAERFQCRGRQGHADDTPHLSPSRRKDIFDQEWSTVWYDEAHDYRRSMTRQYAGALFLRSKAAFTGCVTATPLYTSPLDVINIGRILSIEDFLGKQGLQLEARLREIAKAKATLTEDARSEIRAHQEAELRGRTLDTPNPATEIEAMGYDLIRSLQKSLGAAFLRRGPDSLKPDGTRINEHLPPCELHTLTIELPAKELTALRGNLSDLEKAKRKGMKAFFHDYRTEIGYPRTNKLFPTFKTINEWLAKPSAKLAFTIKLLKHCLLHDDAPPPSLTPEGNILFPECPEVPAGQTAPQTRKILLYHEFPMMAHTIRSALAVNGIPCAVINGSMTITARNTVIRRFINAPNSPRVLLLSSVGGTGLNMARASIVIFYDQVWSAVYAGQVIGRAWRYGQRMKVIVFHILALETSDVMMTSMAGHKGKMLQSLLSKSRNKYLDDVLSTKHVDPDEDVPEKPLPKPKLKRSPPTAPQAPRPSPAHLPSPIQGEGPRVSSLPNTTSQPPVLPHEATTALDDIDLAPQGASSTTPHVDVMDPTNGTGKQFPQPGNPRGDDCAALPVIDTNPGPSPSPQRSISSPLSHTASGPPSNIALSSPGLDHRSLSPAAADELMTAVSPVEPPFTWDSPDLDRCHWENDGAPVSGCSGDIITKELFEEVEAGEGREKNLSEMTAEELFPLGPQPCATTGEGSGSEVGEDVGEGVPMGINHAVPSSAKGKKRAGEELARSQNVKRLIFRQRYEDEDDNPVANIGSLKAVARQH